MGHSTQRITKIQNTDGSSNETRLCDCWSSRWSWRELRTDYSRTINCWKRRYCYWFVSCLVYAVDVYWPLSGYTDLPSRLPTQSSTLYSNNITKFLLSMAPEEKKFGVDPTDEVVRGSIVTENGEVLPPAPRPAPPPAPAPKTADLSKESATLALTPFQKISREVATVAGGMGLAVTLGKFTGPLFMSNVFTAGLASLIGYRVVWGVVPALHSPLMSVTNAISGKIIRSLWRRKAVAHEYHNLGMVGVGGLFVMGGGFVPETIPQALGALSVLLAFVNVSGGFVITKRMLDMFRRTLSSIFFVSLLPVWFTSNNITEYQARRTPPNIPGYTPFPVCCLAEALLLPQALVWLALFKLDI